MAVRVPVNDWGKEQNKKPVSTVGLNANGTIVGKSL